MYHNLDTHVKKNYVPEQQNQKNITISEQRLQTNKKFVNKKKIPIIMLSIRLHFGKYRIPFVQCSEWFRLRAIKETTFNENWFDSKSNIE